MEKIWIRNARLVDGVTCFNGELLLAQGKIAEVGDRIEKPAGEVMEIDAAGQYVFPGAVDPHVHLELPTPAGPSSDDFDTGTRAGLLGGTTCIIDFVTPVRGQSLVEALRERLTVARKSLVDYTFHVGLSDWHEGCKGEMAECIAKFGIRSFKVYLAYRKTIGVGYQELERIMECAQKLDAVLCVHCEDGPEIERLQQQFLAEGHTGPWYHALSRPSVVESTAVKEVIDLCEKTDCAVYLVHMSTATSVDMIGRAKRKGLKLAAETCPQYLLLDQSLYQRHLPESLAYIMSPPLRSAKDREHLWKSLGTQEIEVVSTDHCPFNIKGQKDVGINDFTKVPNGGAGIETRLSLLYTYGVLEGRISMEQFVDAVSVAPARTFGLWPRKGALIPGSDADLVIWDDTFRDTISVTKLAQRCDHTPFEGFGIKGRPGMVIHDGRIAVKNGTCIPSHAKGRFLGHL